MTPQEIMNGMKSKNQALTQKNEDLIDLAEGMAKSKRDYAVAFARKILELKGEGKAATLIPDLARGDKGIAELRMTKDVDKAVYDACRQSVKDIHIALETYRSILTWQRAELNSPGA